MSPEQISVPDKVCSGIGAEDFIKLWIPSIVGEFSSEMREVLDVHHYWHLHFSANLIDPSHFGRVQRKMIFQLTDTDSSVLDRFANDFVCAGLRGIRTDGTDKNTRPLSHFLLGFILVWRPCE